MSKHEKLSPIWNIRYARQQDWLGREAQFSEIEEALASDRVCMLSPQVANIQGTGVTSLVREFAYRNAQDYQMVWWVDAEVDGVSFIQYAQLCMALDMLKGESNHRFHDSVETQHRLESHGGWLLIFDRVKDISVIQALLPKTITGHVIIMTDDAEAVSTSNYPLVSVPPMTPAQLNERYAEMELSQSVVTSPLNGNVLALDLVYAYHVQTGEATDDILVTIIQAMDSLEAPTTHDLFKAVLRYSLNHLSKIDPVVKDFLVLCSFFAPDDIPLFVFENGEDILTPQLIEAIRDEESFQEMLSSLVRLGLLYQTENALAMHPAVQAALHDSMPLNALKAWCSAASKLLEEAFPTEQSLSRPCVRSTRLLPHLLHASDVAENYNCATQITSSLLFLAGMYMHAHGLVGDTHMCYLRSIGIAESVYGTVHPVVAQRVNNLGTIEHELGSLDNAQTCFERSIDIYEALFGPTEDGHHFDVEDAQISTPLRNLCSVLEEKGNVGRAQRAYEKSMKTFVKVYGWEHSIVAECAHSFGNTWVNLKKIDKAKNCFMKAVRAEENAFECDNVSLATYLNSLALCFLKERKPDLALEQLERALRLDENELEIDDLRISRDLINLGHTYKQLQNYDDARTSYIYALKILEADEGTHRNETASIQLNLGVILLGLHEYKEAHKQLAIALQLQTELYGDASTELIPTLVNIGKALDGRKQPVPALSIYERALGLLENQEPDNHIDRATVLYRIGRSYQYDRELDLALEYFEKALAVDTKHAGESHSHVARDAFAIGATLAKQGDSIVAMGHLTLALDIFESSLGKDHAKTRAVRKKLDELHF